MGPRGGGFYTAPVSAPRVLTPAKAGAGGSETVTEEERVRRRENRVDTAPQCDSGQKKTTGGEFVPWE